MTTRVNTASTVGKGRLSVNFISMKYLSRKEPNVGKDSSKESLQSQIPLDNKSLEKEDNNCDDSYSIHSKNSANNSAPNDTLNNKLPISNSKLTSDHSMVCLVETYAK